MPLEWTLSPNTPINRIGTQQERIEVEGEGIEKREMKREQRGPSRELSQLDFTFFVSILSFGKTKILTLYYVNRGVHFGLPKMFFNFLVNNKFRKEN